LVEVGSRNPESIKMCGISGYILKERQQGAAVEVVSLMAGVRLRGPDDEGVCLIDRFEQKIHSFSTDNTHPTAALSVHALGTSLPLHDVAFVHERFSIIDLSPGGHQPFLSQDGSCAVVFNGEIYNYIELRDALAAEGITCWTASDTEVLVEGWRHWRHGLWPRLNGFWAAAIYDARDNAVILCRDRLGVAPLYYRETERGLYFSSLIDPLRKVAPAADELDRDVVQGFLDTGLKDHDGTTAYSSVRSLPCATAVTFDHGQGVGMREARAHVYWHIPAVPLTENDISFKDAVKAVQDTLMDAVRLRLRADVPVAFELSGGLDSSSVVAMAAGMMGQKLTAYTIKVRGRDEEPYARAVAKRFGIDHRVLTDVENDLSRNAEGFSRVMEEPYDTPANYMHHVMLKRIKADGFHVVLTGAGGDESLAGYEASFWPSAGRALRRQGAGCFCQAEWYEFCRRFRSWSGVKKVFSGYARACCRLAGRKVLPARQAISPSRAQEYMNVCAGSDFYAQRLFHVQVGLLPYYLRSTDHYTMNIPLEHRFPLLDYRFLELGMKMPASYLFRGGWTKYVLRQAMKGQLPPSVLWRKNKMGFPFDFKSYFIGRSAEFEKYLKTLETSGFLRAGEADYATLALTDPVRLWRMISVGIWLNNIAVTDIAT
jgi:asparagine synthase (glutamine-hydrolysing)